MKGKVYFAGKDKGKSLLGLRCHYGGGVRGDQRPRKKWAGCRNRLHGRGFIVGKAEATREGWKKTAGVWNL